MKALFQPDYPDKEFYTIVSIFGRLGYFATTDPADSFDFAFSWRDSTWVEPSLVLEAMGSAIPVLNRRCLDISKRRVEALFKEIFGYSSLVDPMRFQGRCVEKHDENAIGGAIVECPLSNVDSRFVHQKYIDARQGNRIIEYRLPVVMGSVPLVYVQQKDIPCDKIKTVTRAVRVAEAQDLFSHGEIRMILDFCRLLGLDFGELDLLRANDDGLIYILDANKTPGGFGMRNRMNWEASDRRIAIDRLSDAFDAGIRERLQRQS